MSEIRYFRIPTEDARPDFSAALWPCLSEIRNAAVVYTSPDGWCLVKAVIGPEEDQMIRDATGISDTLDPAVLPALGIAELFVGLTLTDVYSRFPELQGQIKAGVDPETGQNIMQDIVQDPVWQGIG